MVKTCVVPIDELYRNKAHWSPRKSSRYKMFYDTLEKLVKEVYSGKQYTNEELLNHPYYSYLGSRYRTKTFKSNSRGKKYLLKKIKGHIRLCKDLKENGMVNPIDMYKSGDRWIIERGNRRVIIGKVLGWTEVMVRKFDTRQEVFDAEPISEVGYYDERFI